MIGSGAAGLLSVIIANGLGKTCALVEQHAMGGDCLNVGCVPSKVQTVVLGFWIRFFFNQCTYHVYIYDTYRLYRRNEVLGVVVILLYMCEEYKRIKTEKSCHDIRS